jgi:hypothetical protein
MDCSSRLTVEPEGEHDRRQHRQQRPRAALPVTRRDGEPRAGRRGRTARRQRGTPGGKAADGPASTSPASSSVRRTPGIVTQATVRCCHCEAVRTTLALFSRSKRPAGHPLIGRGTYGARDDGRPRFAIEAAFHGGTRPRRRGAARRGRRTARTGRGAGRDRRYRCRTAGALDRLAAARGAREAVGSAQRAASAMGRIATTTCDAVVPRTKLPEIWPAWSRSASADLPSPSVPCW